MRDRKALKAITNAIMKAHVDDPAGQRVMDKAKAEQFAKAGLKGLHKAGFVVMKRVVMDVVRSGNRAGRFSFSWSRRSRGPQYLTTGSPQL